MLAVVGYLHGHSGRAPDLAAGLEGAEQLVGPGVEDTRVASAALEAAREEHEGVAGGQGDGGGLVKRALGSQQCRSLVLCCTRVAEQSDVRWRGGMSPGVAAALQSSALLH